MTEVAHLEPTHRAQIMVLVVLVLTALLVGSLEPLLNYLTPAKTASLEELETSGRSLMLFGLSIFAVGCFLSFFWIVYFARLGYRTLSLRVFPPPGTVVIARTRVRTGNEAQIAGWLAVALGLLMAVPATALGYLMWLFASAL